MSCCCTLDTLSFVYVVPTVVATEKGKDIACVQLSLCFWCIAWMAELSGSGAPIDTVPQVGRAADIHTSVEDKKRI